MIYTLNYLHEVEACEQEGHCLLPIPEDPPKPPVDMRLHGLIWHYYQLVEDRYPKGCTERCEADQERFFDMIKRYFFEPIDQVQKQLVREAEKPSRAFEGPMQAFDHCTVAFDAGARVPFLFPPALSRL